ncbi:MAG: DUF2064 domain-containing protein [Alphaproteobacteria bacterium]|nr:DUF2064 domain-containing protein [Alphaproteobacteria bacterium]
MKRGILIVMARAPRFGAVKTRLARDIGRLNAWRFYRTTLFETVRRLARNTPWQTVLQVTPDRERSRRRQWPGRAQTLPQGRGDLGARMERGLTGFPRGIPVVLIGSDIPDVTDVHIRKAFNALGQADVVFGQASDGGYWLVGFANRRPMRRPFKTVRWSGPQALHDTCANLGHRRIAFVDELSDVDDGESYRLARKL